MLGLNKKELAVLKKLSTPIKIQNFLDQIPLNHEKRGETYMSPRRVLREKKIHCLEGALLAATALWLRGEEPFLLDLKTADGDDHVVALYRRQGYWGALSKTNHSTLRFRDPVYRTVRELALSYFHEYTDQKMKEKTLRSYSQPFNLTRLGTAWVTAEEDLHFIADRLDRSPHRRLLPKVNRHLLRAPDRLERRAGQLVEWPKTDPRT